MAQQIDFGVPCARGTAAELGNSSTPTRQGQGKEFGLQGRVNQDCSSLLQPGFLHICELCKHPRPQRGAVRCGTCGSEDPGMHHPSSTGASTSTCRPIPLCRHKGRLLLHPPLLGCARADPPGLDAATPNWLCWGSKVQGCPGAHAEGTVPTRHPRVGSSCLCREHHKPSGGGEEGSQLG